MALAPGLLVGAEFDVKMRVASQHWLPDEEGGEDGEAGVARLRWLPPRR
jgi:hypothetical protein